MSDTDPASCARCAALTRRAPVPGQDDGWLRLGIIEVRIIWFGFACPACQDETGWDEREWMMYFASAPDRENAGAQDSQSGR